MVGMPPRHVNLQAFNAYANQRQKFFLSETEDCRLAILYFYSPIIPADTLNIKRKPTCRDLATNWTVVVGFDDGRLDIVDGSV